MNKLILIRATSFIFMISGIFLWSCKSEEVPGIDLDKKPDALEIFAENRISTALYERDIAIAPNGNELIYTLGTFDQKIRALIVVSKRENTWDSGEILSFSGQYQDIEPFYAPNGEMLYFASNRPIFGDTLRNDYNIWVSKKVDDSWGEPTPLDSLINTKGDEFFPAVSKNGNLYFTATREDGIGREDIFISRWKDGAYLPPIPLDSTINTSVYEFNAYVDPDETLLIFSSYGREDELGGGDLYFSHKINGKWAEAQNMGPAVNSEFLDYCPFLDLKRGNLYFTSDRRPTKTSVESVKDIQQKALGNLNGMGNIYRISIEKTKLYE